MKLIIILLFLPYFSSSYWFDCSPCNCLINENDLKTGNCNKNYNTPDLQEIPEKMDKEIKILTFKEQSLTILRQNHFGQFYNLQEIYLNKNKINHVDENALKALPNLTKLDLSYNELSELPMNFFSNTPNLIYLWINNNKLTSLQENLFCNLTYLNEIHLQENNIIEVSKQCFVNVPSLFVVDLSYNNLQNLQLNIIDDVKSIKYFILHENPWVCNRSLCEFRETALKNKWLTTIPDCTAENHEKSWKDLKNYTAYIKENLITVKEEENVEFICEYYSCIQNTFIWKSDHKELKQPDTTLKDDKYISILTLKHVDKSDEGFYTCSVFNCEDCKEGQVYLNVTEKPKNPIKNNKKENKQTTHKIETTTNLPETTAQEASSSSSDVKIILALSLSITIALALALCCCCCCCCPSCCCYIWCLPFKRTCKMILCCKSNICKQLRQLLSKQKPQNNNNKIEETTYKFDVQE